MKILKRYHFAIILLLLSFTPLYAQEHSPQDIVKEWIKVYGVDQDNAAELTSIRLRRGVTKKAWAEDRYRKLRDIGYKHLGGRVLGEKIRDDGLEAMVVLRARIDSVVGISEQTEVYILVLEEGKWLIDEVSVRDEVEVDELEKKLGAWEI